MADPIGGQDLTSTGTGGGLGQGQTPNPAQDIGPGGGGLGGGNTLASYYQGPGGSVHWTMKRVEKKTCPTNPTDSQNCALLMLSLLCSSGPLVSGQIKLRRIAGWRKIAALQSLDTPAAA